MLSVAQSTQLLQHSPPRANQVTLFNHGLNWDAASINQSNQRYMEQAIDDMRQSINHGRLYFLASNTPISEHYNRLAAQGFTDFRLTPIAHQHLDTIDQIIKERLTTDPQVSICSLHTLIEYNFMGLLKPIEQRFLETAIEVLDHDYLSVMKDVLKYDTSLSEKPRLGQSISQQPHLSKNSDSLQHDIKEPLKHISLRQLSVDSAFFHIDNHKPLIFAATLPINSRSSTVVVPTHKNIHFDNVQFEQRHSGFEDQVSVDTLSLKLGVDANTIELDFGDDATRTLRVFNAGAVGKLLPNFQPTIHSGPFAPIYATGLLNGYTAPPTDSEALDFDHVKSPHDHYRVLYLNRLSVKGD